MFKMRRYRGVQRFFVTYDGNFFAREARKNVLTAPGQFLTAQPHFYGGGVRNFLAAENLENNIYSIMYTGSLRIDGAVRSGVTPGAPKTNPLHAPAL